MRLGGASLPRPRFPRWLVGSRSPAHYLPAERGDGCPPPDSRQPVRPRVLVELERVVVGAGGLVAASTRFENSHRTRPILFGRRMSVTTFCARRWALFRSSSHAAISGEKEVPLNGEL